MYIGIIGTRGIPNHYGGFEQFAEYVSAGLVERGHRVVVYNSHTHPYQQKNFKGVELIHCYDPEDRLGTAGQFIYDFNCIMDARKRNFDIILQLGYTSNSIWGKLLPKKPVIVTNMDGLEWKRTKFSPRVQKFLKKAEGWAVATSDYLVADSIGIQQHLMETYQKPSTYIPYGSTVFESPEASILTEFGLKPYEYNMLVARLEPENSIDVILEGVSASTSELPFLVVGKHGTHYGEYLKNKYKDVDKIKFVGGIYNLTKLDNIRFFSNIYFHGHTVGGTNPSLLEAMASGSFICAHDNIFNKAILGEDALYFKQSKEVTLFLDKYSKEDHAHFLANNILKIKKIYSWSIIIDQYESLMKSCLKIGGTKPSKILQE